MADVFAGAIIRSMHRASPAFEKEVNQVPSVLELEDNTGCKTAFEGAQQGRG